ncbi:unnamed protein product [Vitrella brassicaformis CCMP3155]|uniref:Uncharacterized protein n=1 Tax=Vitrella brassicaformis (strain CCMP3155) TaxID=1169540 RepID=A0A0G4FZV9_VITBC|nr:unnamed protein product [Vitrella brassicaformis CCMP3155]|eukprot:CEM20931.1 unnamed protein product [Vitrella brassicaformis CCMP3155]
MTLTLLCVLALLAGPWCVSCQQPPSNIDLKIMPSKKWKFEKQELNRLREELRHEVRRQVEGMEDAIAEQARLRQRSGNVWSMHGAPLFVPAVPPSLSASSMGMMPPSGVMTQPAPGQNQLNLNLGPTQYSPSRYTVQRPMSFRQIDTPAASESGSDPVAGSLLATDGLMPSTAVERSEQQEGDGEDDGTTKNNGIIDNVISQLEDVAGADKQETRDEDDNGQQSDVSEGAAASDESASTTTTTMATTNISSKGDGRFKQEHHTERAAVTKEHLQNGPLPRALAYLYAKHTSRRNV